jgi:hypothetical protein
LRGGDKGMVDLFLRRGPEAGDLPGRGQHSSEDKVTLVSGRVDSGGTLRIPTKWRNGPAELVVTGRYRLSTMLRGG